MIDGLHQGQEVLLQVDVFLAVRAYQDIFPLFKAQAFQHVAMVNLLPVAFQHLPHGRAGHEDGFSVDALAEQVTAAVFRIGQIDIADMIHNLAVDHFAYVPIPAAVARLHMKDRDFQPLGGNGRESRVGIAQNERRVGALIHHNLIALGDDIAHGFAQIAAHGVQVIIRRAQAQLAEEHLIERGIVVLPRMHNHMVKIPVRTAHHRRQTDNLRPGAQHRHQLQLFHCHASLSGCTFRRKVSGLAGS